MILKKIITLCLLCFFVVKIHAQQKISYSLFTYTMPNSVEPDETDPQQKVYCLYGNVSNGRNYLMATIWDVLKAKKDLSDSYLYFINLFKTAYKYKGIADSISEPDVITNKNPAAKWLIGNCKGTDYNIDTEKTVPVFIELHVVTMNNKMAAIHFTSNNINAFKETIKQFMQTVKLKSLK